jgi:hypothetical protein
VFQRTKTQPYIDLSFFFSGAPHELAIFFLFFVKHVQTLHQLPSPPPTTTPTTLSTTNYHTNHPLHSQNPASHAQSPCVVPGPHSQSCFQLSKLFTNLPSPDSPPTPSPSGSTGSPSPCSRPPTRPSRRGCPPPLRTQTRPLPPTTTKTKTTTTTSP